ncbi:hypothetical protein ACHWQZ_G011074 [Mnemiopsis leidyi]
MEEINESSQIEAPPPYEHAVSSGKTPLSPHEEARREMIVCCLGPDLAYFSQEQLDILARCSVDFLTPGESTDRVDDNLRIRDHQSWGGSSEDTSPDAMSCLRTLGRQTENVLETKNCCKVLLVISIASAMLSAVCAVLYRRTEASLWAIVLLFFLVLTSWSLIFRRKRKQIDQILNNI